MMIAGILLGKVGGHLSQCLGGSKADADGHSDTAFDLQVHVLTPGLQVHVLHTLEVDEAFVNAVAEVGRHFLTNEAHYASSEFTIQFVVRREGCNLLIGILLQHLEIGHACLDAQFLGFIRSCHHASIIVRQHHDGLVLQIRPKDTLARNVAVITIDDAVHNLSDYLSKQEHFIVLTPVFISIFRNGRSMLVFVPEFNDVKS